MVVAAAQHLVSCDFRGSKSEMEPYDRMQFCQKISRHLLPFIGVFLHLLSSRRVFLFVSEIYSLLQKSIPLFWSSTEDITVWVWGWKDQSETKVAIFSFNFMVLTRKSHPLFQWTEILERTGINSLIFGWRKPSTCKNCIETSLFDLIFPGLYCSPFQFFFLSREVKCMQRQYWEVVSDLSSQRPSTVSHEMTSTTCVCFGS